MSIGYVSVAKECGALVAAGKMDRATAIASIYDAADGRLTHYDAEDVLDSWQTLRARFGDMLMRTELGIAACEAAIRRHNEEGGAK